MTPRLIVSNPDAATGFYQDALEAVVGDWFVQDDKVVHAALTIGDFSLSISAEFPEWGWVAPSRLGGSPVLLTLDVDNARVVADRMVDNGATVLVPVEDRPYGRCEGRIHDPAGHLWIPTHEIDSTGEGAQRPTETALGVNRIVADLAVSDTTASIDFFAMLFDLDVAMNLDWMATVSPAENPDRQLTLMTDDATAPLNPQVSIEVDDIDTVWRRAQACGADIPYRRTLEPWGVERFFVRDPDGNVINVLCHTVATSTGA